MIKYHVGTHHGVTIVRSGDGYRCGVPGHDCERGHLALVVVNGQLELAREVSALLNAKERTR